MNTITSAMRVVLGFVVLVGCSVCLTTALRAHCDTMEGPVIVEAQAALEQGDVTSVLKWVSREDEPVVRTVFAKTQTVRAMGPAARELADQYFLETLVRLHRASEGEPFTGLKDEPLEPIVAMADKVLADGSPDALIDALSHHMASAVRERFNKVVAAAEHKNDTVETGRAYVEAYVNYMHYVDGIHNAILATADHAHRNMTESYDPASAGHEQHAP